MDNKQIEKKVASLFLEKLLNKKFPENEIENREPPEPDIKFNEFGIEIGSLLVGGFISTENHEKKFFDEINKMAEGIFPENYLIGLVMQDDKLIVRHTPREKTRKYKLLCKYLDCIFISVYPEPLNEQQTQIFLNQKSSHRPSVSLFPKNSKEIKSFMQELADFVKKVPQDKIAPHPLGANYKCYHEVFNEGEVVNSNGIDYLSELFSDKIIRKLAKNKYEGDHEYTILLLHSFEEDKCFSANKHFYIHHRDLVIENLRNLCDKFGTSRLYAGVYFCDFTINAGNTDFDIVTINGCGSLERL